MYKDYFGSYRQISINLSSDDERIDSIKKIKKVLTHNPNFVDNKPLWINRISKFDRLRFLKAVELGEICIYEYDFLEPDTPKTEEDRKIFNIISEHSGSNNENIHILYWRAYNFFKEVGLYFTMDSVYMNLTDENIIAKRMAIRAKYGNGQYNINKNTNKNNSFIFDKKTLIRCGTYSSDEILTGFIYYDYLWIFPHLRFPSEHGWIYEYSAPQNTKIKCYLVENSPEFKEKITREFFENN